MMIKPGPRRVAVNGGVPSSHIESVKRFLSDEGPSTTSQVCDHFKESLSHHRTKEILELGRAEGSIEIFRRGTKVYWMCNDEL